MGINELMTAIAENNKAKGFRDREFNVGEVLMLIVSELGEAMEAHRRGDWAEREKFESIISVPHAPEFWAQQFNILIKDSVEDELADSFIRLLDLSERMGIDLAWHVEQKMKYNATRPRLHGKSY